MRRTLLGLAAGLAVVAWAPTTASANHNCADGLELVCFVGCPNPPKICPWP